MSKPDYREEVGKKKSNTTSLTMCDFFGTSLISKFTRYSLNYHRLVELRFHFISVLEMIIRMIEQVK